jgi:hypothetical protein
MILELAEGPRRKKSNYITVASYKRKPTVAAHKRHRPLNSGDNHIYVPPHLSEGPGIYVREDQFDYLSDADWHTLMDELLEYDPQLNGGLSFGGKGKARRKEKRAKKAAVKREKWERRQKRRDLRTASKAQKRLMKGQRDSEQGSAAPGGSDSGGGGSVLDNIINKGTELVDRVKTNVTGGGGGGAAPDDSEEPQDADAPVNPKPASDNFDIMGMSVPKPVAIGGGAVLAFLLLKVLTKNK